jgi:2-succinyl-5-enolpyruvyl-6-hydroxy-3-cyclohexene-1-carboxylate synthase
LKTIYSKEARVQIRKVLRSWNFFDTKETVTGFSNTGGFGIDGSLSTVIGAALCHGIQTL